MSRATNQNKESANQAEEWVAREVNGERTPNMWYDVFVPDGPLIEVKICRERLSSGRKGRFRLWKSQHEGIRDHDGEYWLMVDGVGIEQRTAKEIDQIIDEHGLSWTGSGNHPRDDKQLKIVWSHILDPDSS